MKKVMRKRILVIILIIGLIYVIDSFYSPPNNFSPISSTENVKFATINIYQADFSENVTIIFDKSGFIGNQTLNDSRLECSRIDVYYLSSIDEVLDSRSICELEEILLKGNTYTFVKPNTTSFSSTAELLIIFYTFRSNSSFNYAVTTEEGIDDFFLDQDIIARGLYLEQNRFTQIRTLLIISIVFVLISIFLKLRKSERVIDQSTITHYIDQGAGSEEIMSELSDSILIDTPIDIRPGVKSLTSKKLKSLASDKLHCVKCENRFDLNMQKCPACDAPASKCAICYNVFDFQDKNIVLPCCKSIVHDIEIIEWLEHRHTCPICRRDIVEFLKN